MTWHELNIGKQHCVYCKHGAELQGSPDTLPKPGDYTICVNCLGVMRFGMGMVLTRVSQAQIDQLSQPMRDEIMRYVRAIRQARQERAQRGET